VDKYVPVAHASDELKRINEFLDKPHLLIGGLAVNQHFRPRTSEDIDLVCPASTVDAMIKQLYPTRYFIHQEINWDSYRPAWVIKERREGGRTTYIGPKIMEREPYEFVDYDWLLQHAKPYRFSRDEKLANIMVPTVEAMALLKLLSLSNRLISKPEKGEQDLVDFVDLINQSEFKPNVFFDLLADDCKEHLATRLAQLRQDRKEPLFAGSALADLFALLFPPDPQPLSSGSVVSVYSPDNALAFYQEVASDYDRRNSSFLYHAHQLVIAQLRNLFNTGATTRVLDLGCGTGRLVAAHFAHRDVHWLAVDGCDEMLDLFSHHTTFAGSLLRVSRVKADLQTIDFLRDIEVTHDGELVAVLSFVLTSLPDETVLERLASSLPNLTTIIVADIYPLYTANHPNYDFSLPDKTVNLTPRPVYPDVVEDILDRAGFRRTDRYLIRRGGTDGDAYAFVNTFKAKDASRESEAHSNAEATIDLLPSNTELSRELLEREARTYEHIRYTIPSAGDERTREMTAVANRVSCLAAAAAASAGQYAPDFLKSTSAGDRIVGLALVQGALLTDEFTRVLAIYNNAASGFEDIQVLQTLLAIAPRLGATQREEVAGAIDVKKAAPEGRYALNFGPIPLLTDQTLEVMRPSVQ
jgi:SAM-dependent methyltransferase